MRVVCLTGDAPRHRSIVAAVAAAAELAGWVIELREPFVPEPPPELEPHLRELFVRHFAGRERAEERFFGGIERPRCPTLEIAREELNGPRVREFVSGCEADVVLSYGVHKLSEETLAAFPEDSWNVHGGLSPWYRGVTTHFWPSYMLEPQMTGVTLHRLTQRIDGGEIVHQTAAPLEAEDGIHELACRTVREFGRELGRVLELRAAGELAPPRPQKGTGKLWLARDWRPEHLRLIYDVFDNRVVRAYLDGELRQFERPVVRQF